MDGVNQRQWILVRNQIANHSLVHRSVALSSGVPRSSPMPKLSIPLRRGISISAREQERPISQTLPHKPGPSGENTSESTTPLRGLSVPNASLDVAVRSEFTTTLDAIPLA